MDTSNKKTTVISETGKAGVAVNPGPNFSVVIEDVPVPKPGPDGLLLRLNATGICYSDIHHMLEDPPTPTMRDFSARSPSHERRGRGHGAGPERQGLARRRPRRRQARLRRLLQLRAQYTVTPARYMTRIPDGVDDFTAGPIMSGGSTIYSSLQDGWGGAKKKLCMKLGFTKVKDVAEEVMRITDEKGAHGDFVKARGNAAYEAAPKMVRVVGRVMCVGLPPAGTCIAGADPH
ncbi:hypothetical protein V2W45_1324018 [Cenococcum geophilum]